MAIILKGKRTVKRGPGGKNWAFAVGGDVVVELRVRGLTSACGCRGHGLCEDCQDPETVWLRILGADPLDGWRKTHWSFRGVIALPGEKGRLEVQRSRKDDDYLEIPAVLQLVWGHYRHAGSGDDRGWLAPFLGSARALHALQWNLGTLPVPNTHELRGRQEQDPHLLDTVEQLMQVIGQNEPAHVTLWDRRQVLGEGLDAQASRSVDIDLTWVESPDGRYRRELGRLMIRMLQTGQPFVLKHLNQEKVNKVTRWRITSFRPL